MCLISLVLLIQVPELNEIVCARALPSRMRMLFLWQQSRAANCTRSLRTGFRRRPFAHIHSNAAHTVATALNCSSTSSAATASIVGQRLARENPFVNPNLPIGAPRWGTSCFSIWKSPRRNCSTLHTTTIQASDMAGASESKSVQQGEFVGSLDCGTT